MRRIIEKVQLALLRLISGGRGVIMGVDFVGPVVVAGDSVVFLHNVTVKRHEDTTPYQGRGLVVLTRCEYTSRTSDQPFDVGIEGILPREPD